MAKRRSEGFTVEFETEKFNKLLAEMAQQVSSATLKSIVRGEVAAVLFSAAQKTKKANKKRITSEVNTQKWEALARKPKPLGGNAAKAKAILNSQKILARKKKRLAEALRRVGAAADGFLYIARKMNLKPLNANQKRGIGKLLTTPPAVNGQPIQHRGTGGKEISTGKGSYAVKVYYGNPVGRWAGAGKALRLAVLGRKNFFRRNLKEGVFKDAKQIAAKYPGIDVTPN